MGLGTEGWLTGPWLLLHFPVSCKPRKKNYWKRNVAVLQTSCHVLIFLLLLGTSVGLTFDFIVLLFITLSSQQPFHCISIRHPSTHFLWRNIHFYTVMDIFWTHLLCCVSLVLAFLVTCDKSRLWLIILIIGHLQFKLNRTIQSSASSLCGPYSNIWQCNGNVSRDNVYKIHHLSSYI